MCAISTIISWSGPNFTGMAIVKGYYYHGQDLFLILVNVFFLSLFFTRNKNGHFYFIAQCVLYLKSIYCHYYNTKYMYLDMASMFFWWKGIDLLNRPSVVSAYQKTKILFLNQIICCGYSKEPSLGRFL